MMAFLDALGAHLQSQGVGTLGTDLMYAVMPANPDVCVTLFEAQGMGPEHVFGGSVSAIERPRLRVMTRAGRQDYPAARAKIEQVRAILGAIRDVNLSGVHFLCVQATSEIYPVNYDHNERPVMGCDFVAWVEA